MSKTKHKPATAHHPAPDPDTDQVCNELRHRIHARGHGRVFLEVNVDDGQAVGAVFDECRETWEDVRRLLEAPPRPRQQAIEGRR